MTESRDVVVFGSGFAAFEVARACAARNMSISVIERGAEVPDENSAQLAAIPWRREPIRSGGLAFGARVPAGFENAARYVGLGGTSELWSGKWRPLDAIDLERQYGDRRWPLSIAELQPWYRSVNAEIGWPDLETDSTVAEAAAIVEAAGLRLVHIRDQSPPQRLRPEWYTLHRERGVAVECLTRVVEPIYDSAGQTMEAVRVHDGNGERLVSASRFVVACGGIESVHLSHELRWPDGGRHSAPPEPESYPGFMDHPKARIGEARVTVGRVLTDYLNDTRQRGHLIALSLPETELQALSIGNHTLAVWPLPDDNGPALQLTVLLEQFPEPGNCVLRRPAPEVSWRISRSTWADCDRFLALLVPRLDRLFGPVTVRPALRFSGASHHAGALPIGADPVGALGSDLRFHDVQNLYCASSAAFPIAGSANPTMTIVALARRLGHLLAGAA